MASFEASPVSADRTISLTRLIDAPRELVFAAWTEPRHMARWFGPRDFSAPDVSADVRPGGIWRVCIRSPGGQDYWMHGTYREVTPPSRLVFTHVWEEGHESPGHETLITVVLEDIGGKTRLSFHKAVLDSREAQISQQAGWSQCLDRLTDYVPTVS